MKTYSVKMTEKPHGVFGAMWARMTTVHPFHAIHSQHEHPSPFFRAQWLMTPEAVFSKTVGLERVECLITEAEVELLD
jgi:hypothetical protein